MKGILLAGVAALGLAGCASTGGLSPAAQQDIATIIAAAQQAAQTACAFEPTAASIAQIVATADPTLIGATAIATGTAIASVFCKAEAAAQGTTVSGVKRARLSGALRSYIPVTIDGVVVTVK